MKRIVVRNSVISKLYFFEMKFQFSLTQFTATTIMSIGMSVKSDTMSNVIRFYLFF